MACSAAWPTCRLAERGCRRLGPLGAEGCLAAQGGAWCLGSGLREPSKHARFPGSSSASPSVLPFPIFPTCRVEEVTPALVHRMRNPALCNGSSNAYTGAGAALPPPRPASFVVTPRCCW